MNTPQIYLTEKDIPASKVIIKTFDPISAMSRGTGGNAMIEDAHKFLKEQIEFNAHAYNAVIIRHSNLASGDGLNYQYYALATPVRLGDKPK